MKREALEKKIETLTKTIKRREIGLVKNRQEKVNLEKKLKEMGEK